MRLMSLSVSSHHWTALPLHPRMAARVVRRIEKQSFRRMWEIVSLQGVPLLFDMSVAILLWKASASFPMLPLVEKTRGVNVLFSTSRTRLLYVRFFSASCFWNTLSMGPLLLLFSSWKTRTSKNVLSTVFQNPDPPCRDVQPCIWSGVSRLEFEGFSCKR